MSYRTTKTVAAFAGLLLSTAITQAQAFDLSWHTIDGGGATFSTGGTYEVGGTIGQPDAGRMTGGIFEISGGFWACAAAGKPCTFPGDLDVDGDVDLSDLATLLASFGTASGATLADGDVDGDGDVDLSDLAALLANFGAACP
ncbi:MAG: hypothetical protein ACKVS9_05600 [Phycisphaerae bacterium]